MSHFRPTKELRSILESVRAEVKPNTPKIPLRKVVTETLADVNDLRFIYGEECLSDEEMEWILRQFEDPQDCVVQDN